MQKNYFNYCESFTPFPPKKTLLQTLPEINRNQLESINPRAKNDKDRTKSYLKANR